MVVVVVVVAVVVVVVVIGIGNLSRLPELEGRYQTLHSLQCFWG